MPTIFFRVKERADKEKNVRMEKQQGKVLPNLRNTLEIKK